MINIFQTGWDHQLDDSFEPTTMSPICEPLIQVYCSILKVFFRKNGWTCFTQELISRSFGPVCTSPNCDEHWDFGLVLEHFWAFFGWFEKNLSERWAKAHPEFFSNLFSQFFLFFLNSLAIFHIFSQCLPNFFPNHPRRQSPQWDLRVLLVLLWRILFAKPQYLGALESFFITTLPPYHGPWLVVLYRMSHTTQLYRDYFISVRWWFHSCFLNFHPYLLGKTIQFDLRIFFKWVVKAPLSKV